MNHKIFVCGDTHGMPRDTQKLNTTNFPQQKSLTKEDVLIQLGDFGWIWYPIDQNKEQEYWLDWLASRNYTLAVVLGNHENYDVIETLPIKEKWGDNARVLHRKKGTIYFLKRGGIYTINGKKILTIGGAESIDKEQRVPNISWWEQERLNFEETELALDAIDANNKEFDYVLTHTCPAKIIREFTNSNQKMKCSVANFLDYIDDTISFKSWHFGHFHIDKTIKRGKYQCHYNNSPHELK